MVLIVRKRRATASFIVPTELLKAQRNGGRGNAVSTRPFAFQGWRSCYLIPAMMAMAYTIGHLPISKAIDALIYFTMRLALYRGSSRYFRESSEEK